MDLLINELLKAAQAAQSGIQESILRALQKVLLTPGISAIEAKTFEGLATNIFAYLESDDDGTRNAAAVLFGVMSKIAPDDLLAANVNTLCGNSDASKSLKQRTGAMAALRYVIYFAYDRVKAKFGSQIVLITQRNLADQAVRTKLR